MRPSPIPSAPRKGFTLVELLVAMTITTIIVGILVSVTSIALDAWNRSRAEIRASRQAKTMVDTMARDFEAMVTRRGNNFEWLSARANPPSEGKLPSSNAVELYFFSAATDRYQGEIGGANDNGGDVSGIGYQLFYKDPIGGSGGNFETFVLNRKLVNPDDAFTSLLGQTDLATRFPSGINDGENFICENVYQFATTFHIEILKTSGTGSSATTTTITMPLTISTDSISDFKVLGTGIEYEGTANTISGVTLTADEIAAGRIVAVEVSLTVLSDFGVDQIRNRNFTTDAQKEEFFAKNSYQYSKRIEVPGM